MKHLKTFKIHVTNKFGAGLSTKKAIDINDLICNRLNKTEAKTWFVIWEHEDPDNCMSRDEWNELVFNKPCPDIDISGDGKGMNFNDTKRHEL